MCFLCGEVNFISQCVVFSDRTVGEHLSEHVRFTVNTKGHLLNRVGTLYREKEKVHLPRGTLSTASSIFLLFVFVTILRALRILKFEIWLPLRRSDLRLNDAAERNNSATMPARNESIQTRDNSVELRLFIFWFTLFFDVFVTILHFLLIFFFPFSVPSVE